MGNIHIEAGDGGDDAKNFSLDLAKAIQKYTKGNLSTKGATLVISGASL